MCLNIKSVKASSLTSMELGEFCPFGQQSKSPCLQIVGGGEHLVLKKKLKLGFFKPQVKAEVIFKALKSGIGH